MQYIDFINPDRIQWCCDDTGISLYELAIETGLSLDKISSDKPSLTFNQLSKIATFFGRGVLFFLDKNDVCEEKIHSVNFRTLANQKPNLSLTLKKLIERVEFQRERYLGLIEDIDLEAPKQYQPPKLNESIPIAAEETREWLNLGDKNSFETYRKAIEDQGILVFQSNGYGGKWQIPKESPILGFSLYDPTCPLIVVRKQQWETQQVFTLMHELGHLLLHRASSIDDADDLNAHVGREFQANQFAGLVLIPDTFLDQINIANKPEGYHSYIDWLKPYSKIWGVSTEVVLRRLHDIGFVEQADYEGFRRWVSNQKIPSKTGGNRSYRHREPQHIFGGKYVRTVFDAKNSKKISLSKVSSYLDGLKVKDIHLLERHLASY